MVFVDGGCFVFHSCHDLAEELIAQLLLHQLHHFEILLVLELNLLVLENDHSVLVFTPNKLRQSTVVSVKLVLYFLFLYRILAASDLLLQIGDFCSKFVTLQFEIKRPTAAILCPLLVVLK